jgi:hypothetical protein
MIPRCAAQRWTFGQWSSAVSHGAGSKFAIEYLGKFETEVDNILGS